MELEKFTYRDLTKTESRNEMLDNDISSLGTQAGGFGMFTEQARVLTLSGAEKIKGELEHSACLNIDELFDACPSLKLLIK